MTKYHEINVLHIKPKYHKEYLVSSVGGMDILAKAGYKFLGVWVTDTGGEGPEVVYIDEWESLAKREEVRKSLQTNPEWQNYSATTMKMVRYVETSLVCPIPGMDLAKVVHPDKKLILEKHNCKGSPFKALDRHHKFATAFKEVNKGHNDPIFCTPLFGPAFPGLWMLMSGDNTDELLKQYLAFFGEAKNWPLVSEVFEEVQPSSVRLLAPKPKM